MRSIQKVFEEDSPNPYQPEIRIVSGFHYRNCTILKLHDAEDGSMSMAIRVGLLNDYASFRKCQDVIEIPPAHSRSMDPTQLLDVAASIVDDYHDAVRGIDPAPRTLFIEQRGVRRSKFAFHVIAITSAGTWRLLVRSPFLYRDSAAAEQAVRELFTEVAEAVLKTRWTPDHYGGSALDALQAEAVRRGWSDEPPAKVETKVSAIR